MSNIVNPNERAFQTVCRQIEEMAERKDVIRRALSKVEDDLRLIYESSWEVSRRLAQLELLSQAYRRGEDIVFTKLAMTDDPREVT